MRSPFRKKSNGSRWVERLIIQLLTTQPRRPSNQAAAQPAPVHQRIEALRRAYSDAISRRDKAYEALKLLNRPSPSDETIRLAEEAVKCARDAIARLRDRQYCNYSLWRWALWTRVKLGSALKAPALNWVAGGLMMAIPAFAVALPIGLAIGLRGITILGPPIIAYGVSASVFSIVFRHFDKSVFGGDFGGLSSWLADRHQQIQTAKSRLQNALKQLSELRFARTRHEEYAATSARVAEFEQQIRDQRIRLQLTDWRSMRGKEFERFLADVFQALGYAVETTKATGDQGVDLLVNGKSFRLAVQVKGYVNSVGNSAVMEVNAGMTYYGCQSCCVITNSVFTAAAKQLASRLGCKLIDGSMISPLIEGNIYPQTT